MMKRCLVVGGNGFIGKNLVEKLISNNYHVIVYDIATQSIRDILGNHKSITYIEGDVNNSPYLIDGLGETESVVWLTHTSVPATSTFNIEEDLVSNVPPLIKFVQHLIRNSNTKCFIYLSSGGTIYGNPFIFSPISENNETNPISAYGLTKLVAEEYLSFLLSKSSIKSFILRPSNVYGRYQNMARPQGIIGFIFKSILTNRPINIYGDGTAVRDYLYVSDLTESIYLCLGNTKTFRNPLILNIGSGIPLTINELIIAITEISGHSIDVVNLPERGFDCKYNVLSINKAKDTINWVPTTCLATGLNQVWNWMRMTLTNQT
jgi:UDP-glucose 4-epimerase